MELSWAIGAAGELQADRGGPPPGERDGGAGGGDVASSVHCVALGEAMVRLMQGRRPGLEEAGRAFGRAYV
eukprot:scaffold2325_cov374-Prasinococcus_capsulatus_cf.AAC.6